MEILSGVAEGLGNINWEVIAQLLFVTLIMLSGPIVIVVLAFRNGDL
jgi:phage shock protein PspC (stress-responsive transcriptional regulator)